jgi:CRISPR-associated endonuclease/helicase Cas3
LSVACVWVRWLVVGVLRESLLMTRRPFEDPDETAWGKSRGLDRAYPPYPLVRHLLDAAAMALYLWDHYLSDTQRCSITVGIGVAGAPDRARSVVALCAGLHDLGKLSGFQFCDAWAAGLLSRELDEDRGKIDSERLSHDVAGMECMPVVLDALGFDDAEGSAAVRIAEVIGGHHGIFSRFEWERVDNSVYRDQLGGAAWARQREAHAAAVFDMLGRPLEPEQFKAPAAVLVTGLVILADWLVSQEDYLCRRQRHLGPSLKRHFARSCVDAGVLVREAGLLPVKLNRKEFAEAYKIDGEPNALQRSVMEDLPAAVGAAGADSSKAGILLVTAAPGDGKTELALEAERVMSGAFGTHGFAFLLPTMATSDQMHGRVAGVLARQDGQGGGLTLSHSMAWLNAAYTDDHLNTGQDVLVCDGDEKAGASRAERRAAAHQAAMRPRRWLRGGKRPLLAQYVVGTVDQALMAVLPVRHNALRMLALSGKTVIVDEAHAYDPYMQVLLGRLLNWLGWYGVPVILLSATLPASISDRLIKEYLRGAGADSDVCEGRTFPAPYPGWVYVDAPSGHCTAIHPSRQEEQARQRHMELHVEVEAVTQAKQGSRGRLAAIDRRLAPLVADQGCALIVCNTVPEAQATYEWLRKRYVGKGLGEDDLKLLHARFPGDEREALTTEVVAGLGREGPRPTRRIIVATQVVEQSLDLDADVVISDLAPLALLLQRAGRCWRHENWWSARGRPQKGERPDWTEGKARLVVLDPLAGGGSVPEQWGDVYAEFVLTETSTALAGRGRDPISVPDEVQGLVELVHGDREDRFDWEQPQQSAAWSAFVGENLAKESLGSAVAIPRARSVRGLDALHRKGVVDESKAATRLGAESVRLLCVYRHEDDSVTLDLKGETPLPETSDDGRIGAGDVRRVMRRTIPVRADWFPEDVQAHRPPAGWAEHPMLGDLLVLEQPVREQMVRSVEVRGKQIYLDTELGLVRG